MCGHRGVWWQLSSSRSWLVGLRLLLCLLGLIARHAVHNSDGERAGGGAAPLASSPAASAGGVLGLLQIAVVQLYRLRRLMFQKMALESLSDWVWTVVWWGVGCVGCGLRGRSRHSSRGGWRTWGVGLEAGSGGGARGAGGSRAAGGIRSRGRPWGSWGAGGTAGLHCLEYRTGRLVVLPIACSPLMTR